MEGIGQKLREIRQKRGLSLREVERRSLRLAKDWGYPSYRISASWLDRVEREDHRLAAAKLIVLAVIYSMPPEELFALCVRENDDPFQFDHVSSPNTTLLLTGGSLEKQAKLWLPDNAAGEPVPEETTLLSPQDQLPGNYRRGVIGRRDTTMDPMIRAGSIVLINVQRRAIASRREWTNEFDRPIYFLLTRAGYVCGWCELDKEGQWLTLAPHPLSYATGGRWRYRKEVEVIGQVAMVLLRLENPTFDT